MTDGWTAEEIRILTRKGGGMTEDELQAKAARERRYDLRTPIIRAIYDVMQAIEACGASEKLTRAVTLAGELMEPTRVLLEERDALLDRLQAAERDAARYRWLRVADDVPKLRGDMDFLTGAYLDAAIDAAQGAQDTPWGCVT